MLTCHESNFVRKRRVNLITPLKYCQVILYQRILSIMILPLMIRNGHPNINISSPSLITIEKYSSQPSQSLDTKGLWIPTPIPALLATIYVRKGKLVKFRGHVRLFFTEKSVWCSSFWVQARRFKNQNAILQISIDLIILICSNEKEPLKSKLENLEWQKLLQLS